MPAFELFSRKHGPPTECRTVLPSVVQQYADALPAELLRFWEQNGWCGYGQGLLWTVNPADFDDVLKDWLPRPTKYRAVVRTAFACIFVWDGQQVHYIDTLHGVILPNVRDIVAFFDIFLCLEDALNTTLKRPDFVQALTQLGPLTADECYGCFPAVAMGGSGSPDTLRRVKLREHLALLRQLR